MRTNFDYNLKEIIDRRIGWFNLRRLEKIRKTKVIDLLKRKNPYLFIAQQVETPEVLAEALVRASLSSSEETLFGNALEEIAIDICEATFGGQKSTTTGIDLDFSRDGIRHLVAIKSGPNWGNSGQIKKLRQDFKTAIRVAKQSDRTLNIQAVNGCCYGTDNREYGDYRKICGRAFWELISGDELLFHQLVIEIDKASTNGYQQDIARAVEQITGELKADWSEDGVISWSRIIRLNSEGT